MSSAVITVEFDEETGQMSIALSGDGYARKVANEILDQFSEGHTGYRGKQVIDIGAKPKEMP